MSTDPFKQYIDKNDFVKANVALGQLSPRAIQKLHLENSLYYAAKQGKSLFVNLFLEHAGKSGPALSH